MKLVIDLAAMRADDNGPRPLVSERAAHTPSRLSRTEVCPFSPSDGQEQLEVLQLEAHALTRPLTHLVVTLIFLSINIHVIHGEGGELRDGVRVDPAAGPSVFFAVGEAHFSRQPE